MTVARILIEKGSSVVTISPAHTLDAAIHLLAEKSIGALVVTEADGAVAGILSERDIMRVLSKLGAAALDEPVSAHMTRKVTTCGRTTTVEEVMQTMTAGRFRHVPVVDEGNLCGIISIGDVVKARIDELATETQQLVGYIRDGR